MTKEEIGKIIKNTRISKKLTQSQVAEKMKRPQQTIANWEVGRSQPDANTLFELFQVLGADLNQAFGFTHKKAPSYSDEAMKLAYDFDNRLDSWGKKQVRNVTDNEILRYEAELSHIKEKGNIYKIDNNIMSLKEQKVIYLPEPLQSASAGTGQIADDDTAEQVAVYYNEKTSKADYIMRVSGDSMEPKFMNGDRVLVRSQPAVEIGEIGIFIVDGEQYVKIYRGSYLESLNPQYNNIEVSERSFCRGKVIGVLDPEWIAE